MKPNKVKLFPSLWAILESELTKIEAMYSGLTNDMIAGLEKDSKLALNRADIPQTRLSKDVSIVDNIGILRIDGVITPKADFFTMFFGGATLDTLTSDFKMLVNNDQIDTIILDIDSPGGTVSGVQEFANMVFDARDHKTIVAISSSIMTSAAMWIGAAAESVYITGGTVTTGSIGVLTTHVDVSGYHKQMGVKATEITAGKYKRIASSYAPLTDEGRDELQSQVDKVMTAFVSDIAKFRGASEQDVISNMADGKIFIGDDAINAGLVDDIKTFDLLIETINDGGVNMGLFAKNKEANLDNLKAEHSALYDEAVAIGVDQGKSASAEAVKSAEEASYKNGLEAGVAAERARIQGINDCTITGQEDLAKTLIADGKTTPGEAAIKMINANKKANVDGLETIRKTSANAVEDEPEQTIPATKKKEDMTAKEQWDADPKLAKEFSGFAAFEAMTKNTGNFKVLRK